MPQAQEASEKSSLVYKIVLPCLLSLLTVLIYWSSLHYDFRFDDIANIQKHFYIRHHSLWSLWFSGSRWISYWLNAVHYSIGKFDPFSYRLGNLIIHIINGILVFFLLLFALAHSKGTSFFKKNALAIASITSALFLLHPVQSQTVLYICQGQLEGLACMGILALCLIFLHMCHAKRYVSKSALGALLFTVAIFACFTKEIAIISPCLVLLVDWFFVAYGDIKSLRSRWLIHTALFVLVFGIYLWQLKPSFFTDILGFKLIAQNNMGNIITQSGQDPIRPWPFFISQFKVILHYIGIFIWPFNICVEYDWVLSQGFFALDCFFPFLLLNCIGFGILRLLYTNRTQIIAFGALWFFICIAPRSSIIPSPELLVDYKTYTASLGWLLIVSCCIVKLYTYVCAKIDLLNRKLYAHQVRIALSACCILPLCLMTYKRTQVWSSGTEFWMNVIQHAPRKARAYNNYAIELSETQKRYADAIPYFRKAIKIDPTYAEAFNNLAVCYANLDKIDEAIQAQIQSLKIDRRYAEGYNNLASFYLLKKDYANTEKYIKIALQMRPHYGKAYVNLGLMYTELGEARKSLVYLKKACTEADLDNEYGYSTYAQAALKLHEYDEAIWGLKKTLECAPNHYETMYNLAYTYYHAQRTDKAKELYLALLEQNNSDLRVRFNLGEAYLAEEDYSEAFKYFKDIEPYVEQYPQIRIRLANCYEKAGNIAAACNELLILTQQNDIDQNLRLTASQLLTQLNTYYNQPEITI